MNADVGTRLVGQTLTWVRRPETVIRRRFLMACFLAAYAVALHWTYQAKISPVTGYLGLRYSEPNRRKGEGRGWQGSEVSGPPVSPPVQLVGVAL